MSTLAFIDLYCERTESGFWNEPFNAISNLAFLIAAASAWYTLQRRQFSDIWEKLLIILAGGIGIGSFLFHTFATPWAELADIIPIRIFVTFFVLLVIYRATDQNLRKTLRIALIMMAATLIVSWFSTADINSATNPELLPLNGSLQYTPALFALVVVACIAQWRKHSSRNYLALATALFCLALTFRTVDLSTCTATLGIGTHFIWHLLNGLLIGVLLHAMILTLPPPDK